MHTSFRILSDSNRFFLTSLTPEFLLFVRAAVLVVGKLLVSVFGFNFSGIGLSVLYYSTALDYVLDQ